MTITYVYGKNLYVNLTNRCPNACDFCLRTTGDHVGDSGSLWLEREPTKEEILTELEKRDLSHYEQLVYCGFGEPTYRLEDIKWISAKVREMSPIPIRINTNGLSDLIHKRSTAEEICQAVDSISISLNMPDAASYNEVVRPAYGEKSFDAMLKFARDCKQYLDDVRFTVVDVIGEEKVEQSKILAAQNGIPLRVRKYSP